MTAHLLVQSAGPNVTVQDQGRAGYLAQGLSRGGAADWLALCEGAALLGQSETCAALEMAGTGGSFQVSAPTRIALTGAPMAARLDGTPLVWNASHAIRPDQTLVIGAARAGVYGYLHLGGGIATPQILGSRSCHITAGIGAPVSAGDTLPLGDDTGKQVGQVLEVEDRVSGGAVRLLPTAQTDLFDAATQDRFCATAFTRDRRGNRQGIRLDFNGAPFVGAGQLSILSEIIMAGDVQMTGDGTPYILLPDCQTTGGYPRLGTVVPMDLPRVAQANAGAPLAFRFVTRAQALADDISPSHARAAALRRLRPLVRDPHDIADLLGYQLIGGVISATDP